MSDWNEELPRFKEARRLPAEQHRPVSGGKRQKREWLVVEPFQYAVGPKAGKSEIKRYGGIVRYRGVDRAAEYVARHKARFDRWRIVGPQGEEQ